MLRHRPSLLSPLCGILLLTGSVVVCSAEEAAATPIAAVVAAPGATAPGAAAPGAATFAPDQIAFFEKEIRPVLAEICLDCHDGKKAKLGLELNHRQGWIKGSDYRKVIDLEHPEASVVIKALSHSAEKNIPAMPEKREKLSPETIAKFTTWIGMGLPWPATDATEKATDPRDHWSFRPVQPTVLPENAGNPIDYFIHQAQQKAGVTRSLRADRYTLYRRASFDLLGLPPEFEASEKFIQNARIHEDLWPKLVDEMLASPRYGERWARHWMDVARYSDTKGYEGAGTERRFIYSYTYRDWLIRAFNEDLPYDQFVLYQLAAEQIVDSNGPEKRHLAALGFLSLSKNGSQDDILDDRIDTTTRGLMALTVSCAKCHDHKFDPIPTKDYYSLYGIFMNSMAQDTPVIGEPKVGPEYDKYLADLAKERKTVDDFLTPILATVSKENPDLAGQRDKLINKMNRDDRRKLTTLEGKVNKFIADSGMEADKAIILKDREKLGDQYVHIRGSAARRGELAPRQFLAIASEGAQKPFTTGSGRLELAKDIVRPNNPLTARNIVNRVWMWHFGEGIVRTVDDFGHQGESPDHPELLDWLANWFVENDWSLKKLHRLILTSETWQQASSNERATENMLVDSENRFLWKFKKKRLDLEQMRDGILDVAGSLSDEMFGRAVPILEPPYSNRRSVYAFIDRQNLNPTFRNFDFSNPQETSAQRPSTTIPMQALFTLNNPFMQDQAAVLAEKTKTSDDRVAALHRAVFARNPSESDRQLAESFVTVFDSESSALGKRQTDSEWSYGWGDLDAITGKVVFHPFEFWIKDAWQVGKVRPLKDNPLSYLYAQAGATHPGYTKKESAIYEWRAPAELRVKVSGTVSRNAVGKGNGVRVKVVTGAGVVVFDQLLDPAKSTLPVTIPEVKLAKYECLYFIIDPHEDNSSFDSVTWSPQIADLDGKWAQWGLAESFSGPSKPATTWGAYTQALLNTNRFLFIE